jgi:hypothetical protein
MSTASAASERTHLVVLVHGVAGAATDLQYLGSLLAKRPEVLVLAPRCNEPLLKPFEGVVAGGERLVAVILDEIAQTPSLSKISLIGHSLGGLYVRYIAGVLFGRCNCALEPINLITIATPHLGVRRPTSRPLLKGGALNRLFGLVAETMCAQLGTELTLNDDLTEPLLTQLCKGPYLHALRRFRARRLYSNVFNDFLVPYCTASIQPYNPYRRGLYPLAVSPLYPHITLCSLYRLALGAGRPVPPVQPHLFPDVGRAFAPEGDLAAARALAPLSLAAHRLECAIDDARASAAYASGDFSVPPFARTSSEPARSAADGGAHAAEHLVLSAAAKRSASQPGPRAVTSDLKAWAEHSSPPHSPRAEKGGAPGAAGVDGTLPPLALSRSLSARTLGRLRVDLQRTDTSGWDESFCAESGEKREHLLRMLYGLNSVSWERVDCIFQTSAAHEQIVNKNAWTSAIGFDTGDVCRHIVDGFTL